MSIIQFVSQEYSQSIGSGSDNYVLSVLYKFYQICVVMFTNVDKKHCTFVETI